MVEAGTERVFPPAQTPALQLLIVMNQTTPVCCLALLLSVAAIAHAQQPAPVPRPNLLLITADDLNWDTPGCFGGAVAKDVTPNIDRLAQTGMRFFHAHVNVAVCTPSRTIMLTGLYPQHSGVAGFQPIKSRTPTLPALLNQMGYLCGTIGKPLGQPETFRWSAAYRWQAAGDEDMWGRDGAVFRKFAASFFQLAKDSGQPFFLMANSHDPHRPFAGSELEQRRFGKPHYERAEPSRHFQPAEVTVPGFLPDLPEVRQELAEYASSARRLDDTVGAILDQLERSGLSENTLVIFLSDHGMPFPFAKSNCYLHSTRTPLIVRWPGHVQPGSVDHEHMIATIDLVPTILAALEISEEALSTYPGPDAEAPQKPNLKFDGRSFLPILQGQQQTGRDYVFTQFNHIHGHRPYPMRGVLTREFAYIFNTWSDGERQYRAAPLSGLTFAAMQKAAAQDPAIAARVRQVEYRTVEELYHVDRDPDCLTNLVDDTSSEEVLTRLRSKLADWMRDVNDPVLAAFEKRDSAEARAAFMQQYAERIKREIELRQEYEDLTGYRF